MTTPRRRSACPPWSWTLPLVLALITAASCSGDPRPAVRSTDATAAPNTTPAGPAPGSTPSGPATAEASAATPEPPAASGVTRVRVTVGDRTFGAELYDNPTAHDLADGLPVTVTMDDLHGSEKTGPLPRALTTDGVPGGSDPEVNEIGYYAPGRDLVLYYGDVGYFNGIVRIGRFDGDIVGIADQPDGISVTLERA